MFAVKLWYRILRADGRLHVRIVASPIREETAVILDCVYMKYRRLRPLTEWIEESRFFIIDRSLSNTEIEQLMEEEYPNTAWCVLSRDELVRKD